MKKHNLLLIEDNPLLIDMYKSAFEENGIKVYVARDGAEGVVLAKKHKPEVIVLDLLMHGMDGFDVLSALKNDTDFQTTKKVILTAVTADASKKKAEKFGADAYLIKSEVDLETIVRRVSEFFAQ